MKRQAKIICALLAICVGIAIAPLLFIHDSEFGGADGQAEAVITEIRPDYKPWAESLFTLPGGETEGLLFALQAALGAGILGLGFGYLKGRAVREKEISRRNSA